LFENVVLRRISGPNREEVMGDQRKLHNGLLHNSYSSPNTIRQIKSRRMQWVGHVERKMYKVLVGKPKGKRPLGRLRHRWDQNGS
jgi:hypothetical protein